MDQTHSELTPHSKTGRRGMKPWQTVVWIIVALLFLCLFYISVDANKFKTQVRVSKEANTVGVNPTTSSLDFGDLSRGSTAGRKVKITNNTPLPMRISVLELGEIRDLLKIPRNNFMLASKETTEVEFFVTLPASAEIDHVYNGRVIIFRIPTLF